MTFTYAKQPITYTHGAPVDFLVVPVSLAFPYGLARGHMAFAGFVHSLELEHLRRKNTGGGCSAPGWRSVPPRGDAAVDRLMRARPLPRLRNERRRARFGSGHRRGRPVRGAPHRRAERVDPGDGPLGATRAVPVRSRSLERTAGRQGSARVDLLLAA